jgi:hypothetical protein
MERSFPTCLHEAGHALSYLVHGDRAQVTEVTVDGASGNCRVGSRGFSQIERAVAHLAGYVAEEGAQHGLGWRPDPAWFRDHADAADVRGAVTALGTDDPKVLLLVWDQAARLLGRHWVFVVAAAAHLACGEGRLSGEQVAALWSRWRGVVLPKTV